MSEQVEALRKWFHANKTSPEFKLAERRRHAMDPGVARVLLDGYPAEGASEEEKELALMLALCANTDKLASLEALITSIRPEHFPKDIQPHEVDDRLAKRDARIAELEAELANRHIAPPPETQPELVAASHVDTMPLVSHEDPSKPTE